MESLYTTSKLKYNTDIIKWENVPTGNTFQMYTFDDIPSEISVHILGTFGGTTVSIYGGNLSSNVTSLLQQINGDNATATSEDMFSVLDRPLYITPTMTGGSGSSVSVIMAVKYNYN